MERLVTESIAEILAARTAEKVRETFEARWGAVISEFVNTQKSNVALNRRLEDMQQTLTTQNQSIQEELTHLREEIKTTREQQRKAAEILNAARKELGLSE